MELRHGTPEEAGMLPDRVERTKGFRQISGLDAVA